VGHPARNKVVKGTIQGEALVQYDFTPQQYAALIKLTASLSKVFPKIKCDYPRDSEGKLIPRKLTDSDLKAYAGVLGHFTCRPIKMTRGRLSNGIPSSRERAVSLMEAFRRQRTQRAVDT
jgi:N-acetylmuramoyl-L-alanine amidase